MTATLPPRVPLEPPPGDPAALGDLEARVAGAAFCLAVLDTSLTGSAGSATNWHGDDAAAAAGAVATVTALAREAAAALFTAAGRLATHQERLLEARRRIGALVAEQEDDYAAAWAQLGALPDPVTAMRAGAPAAVAVVEGLEAAEAARRREHATVLEEVAVDATATSRVLAGCSAVVGGTGRSGDASRAVAHLALALPAWGAVELAARGRALAEEWQLAAPDEREAVAQEAAAYAAAPAFAEAFLAGLGPLGVENTLVALGDGGLPSDSAVAAVLAWALGAASRSGGAVDPVGEVLDARYVAPDDTSTNPDVIALGMGAVLAAGLSGRSSGPAPGTVLAWGRQLLAREQAMSADPIGARAVDRANAPTDVMDPIDPLALVADTLARTEDPAFAAALLGGPQAWDGLLARSWDDGAASLSGLVERAAVDSEPAGEAAVRAGLIALGTGLEDGDPDGWTVQRETAAAVAPALGAAVAAHVAVAVDVLWAGVDAPGDTPRTDAMRGLGMVTLDRGAAAVVGEALFDWARAEIAAGTVIDPSAPAPAVAVPSAYLAVQEYGQRLDHTLDAFEARAAAQRRALGWDLTVGLVGYLPGMAGNVGGVIEGYAAIALDMDGTWDNGVDRGLVFDGGTAADASRADLGPAAAAEAREVARQARIAFHRTAAVLGDPTPPESPPVDYLGPLFDALLPGPDDLRRPGGRGAAARPTG
jgi:hypothetical protein